MTDWPRFAENIVGLTLALGPAFVLGACAMRGMPLRVCGFWFVVGGLANSIFVSVCGGQFSYHQGFVIAPVLAACHISECRRLARLRAIIEDGFLDPCARGRTHVWRILFEVWSSGRVDDVIRAASGSRS